MQDEELYLILGCFGRIENQFALCRGVENRILKIDESLVCYNEICDYMESVRLFDKPMFDINSIRHFIYNMQEKYDQKIKRLWTETQYSLYEKFIYSHKACGLYIRLIVVSPEADIKKEQSNIPKEEKIIIKGTPEPALANKTHYLINMRNRK